MKFFCGVIFFVGVMCVSFSFGKVTDRSADFKVAEGFKLEHLYKVAEGEGSWVALTVDGRGRLIAADQYGGLFRVTVPLAGGGGEDVKVEPLDVPLGGAHGLLWNEGVLYVSVNERARKDGFAVERGVWMVEEDGDGWGEPELVMPIKTSGEHGIHSLVLSPDGGWIYLATGNYAGVPEVSDCFPARVWGEDQLLERNADGRGHAAKVVAPAGWVGRFRLDGSDWQLVSMGQRNTFGVAFHDSGELISYDADMEWDFGMPWYRPTRICHIVPGGELGWRSGSGKWPAYYEDSMGALLDVGPGSPTGVFAGRGFRAPARYQQAIFAFDWTFATIYAIHLEADGASFKASKEEFVAGAGLPLTDGVVGADGAMYFVTGGRRGESDLWRVVYTGDEDTVAVTGGFVKDEGRARLASFIESPEGAELDFIYESLGSKERTLRFMGRAALERFPDRGWVSRLEGEEDEWTRILGAMALVRLDAGASRDMVLSLLLDMEWEGLTSEQKLNWLRVVGLVFIRDGRPSEVERDEVLGKVDSFFPSGEHFVDFELARMLCYLEARGVVGRVLGVMDEAPAEGSEEWGELVGRNYKYGKDIAAVMKNHPPTSQIHYLYCLRAVAGPWEVGERRRVFNWFREIEGRSGGGSYALTVAAIRRQIFENGSEEERREFAREVRAPVKKVGRLPAIQGPGRAWTTDEVVRVVDGDLSGKDMKNGKAMFEASLCSMCHRFGVEGGAQGPDLTNLAGRFSVRDLASSIVDPSAVISDQYEFTEFIRHDGGKVVGRVLNEQDEVLSLGSNPFDFSQRVELSRGDVKSEMPSKVSPMPPTMINRLNEEELKDLFGYLLGR